MFNELKNKLGQKKAWGSSLVAKQTQVRFLVLTHNLILLYERRLEQRRAKRTAKWLQPPCHQGGRALQPCAASTAGHSVQGEVHPMAAPVAAQSTREAAAVLRLKLLYAPL